MKKINETKIRQNFYELIVSTSCSLQFLEKFKSLNILSLSDIRAILEVTESTTPMDQAYQFYKRLLQKLPENRRLYEILLNALRETGQIIPFEILNSELRTGGGQVDYFTDTELDLVPVLEEDQPLEDPQANLFRRTRGRYCDLPTKLLKEAALGWTNEEINGQVIFITP